MAGDPEAVRPGAAAAGPVVAPGRGTVRVEVVPWLAEAFGHAGGSRLVLEAELEVVHDDTLLGAQAALEARIVSGDVLAFLSAFSGG